MKLTVKCFATLMPLTPPDGSLEFHGTDVCDLLRQLSIPESEARIIFVNGIGVEKDALLHDGDRVGSCMRRQPIQERESMREHRFFRGEGEPLPFLFGEHH